VFPEIRTCSAPGRNPVKGVDQLLAMAEATPPARPGLSAQDHPIWTAYRAVTVAETRRCRDSAGQAASWERAASSCSAIGCRWYEAMSRWRWAQALLSEGAARSAVAEPLRQAHSIAMQMGAGPLVAETESLALAPGSASPPQAADQSRPRSIPSWQR
jgi:hypothetical protein